MESGLLTVDMPRRTAQPRRNHTAKADPQRAAFEAIFKLLEEIADWCFERSDRIKDTFLELAPDGLALYIVAKSEAFDFDLNNELADFTVKLIATAPIHSVLVPSSCPVDGDGFKEGHSVFRLQITRSHAE